MVKAQAALYELHIEAFLEGIAEEAPQPAEFGLSEKEGLEIRRKRYAQFREELATRAA